MVLIVGQRSGASWRAVVVDEFATLELSPSEPDASSGLWGHVLAPLQVSFNPDMAGRNALRTGHSPTTGSRAGRSSRNAGKF